MIRFHLNAMPLYAEKNRWREGSPLISLAASSFPFGGRPGSPYGVPKGPRLAAIGGIGINRVETSHLIMTAIIDAYDLLIKVNLPKDIRSTLNIVLIIKNLGVSKLKPVKTSQIGDTLIMPLTLAVYSTKVKKCLVL